MPHGFGGVWMAVILGDTVVQRHRGDRGHLGRGARPGALDSRGAAHHGLRLFLFYILALTIVVTFVPWTETGARW